MHKSQYSNIRNMKANQKMINPTVTVFIQSELDEIPDWELKDTNNWTK